MENKPAKRGETRGKIENLKPFSKDNQPSSDAKSKGWRKKRAFKKLAEAPFTGKQLKECRQLAKRLGLTIEDFEFTVELTLTLKQIEKALNDGDTKSYTAVMDRLRGKPQVYIDQTVSTTDLSIEEARAELEELRKKQDKTS